jgi:uncharacterized protein YdiU (UPF0061 family)
MLLGEVYNEKTNQYWEIQFKGSGLTACSRGNDGRKVLRSSIREFLCSELMSGLQIPTTRAGSVVDSMSTVIRDQFYTGHPRRERCAVITRIAPTFLRFGSFEICKPTDPETGRAGPSSGNMTLLKQLLEFTLDTYFPTLNRNGTAFLLEVARRTAMLVAMWDSVGFTHGVLNTDNMSILGLTLDYGPFGFMEYFDPSFVPNTSDDQGRYAFRNQKAVCLWNVQKLWEVTREVMDSPPPKWEEIRDEFLVTYKNEYWKRMSRKLGLKESADQTLIPDLLSCMNDTATDFTRFFIALRRIHMKSQIENDLQNILSCVGSIRVLKRLKSPSYHPTQIELIKQMIERGDPRISEEQTDFFREEINKFGQFQNVISKWTEKDKQTNDVRIWKSWLVKYREQLQHHELENRSEMMRITNPIFVLRNHVAQKAIEKAEQGDYSEVNRLLKRCLNPYENVKEKIDDGIILASSNSNNNNNDNNQLEAVEQLRDELPPQYEEAFECLVSCSS